MVVRLLAEERFDPPRAVEVWQDDRWWPAQQSSWRLCDDARGWMAEVRWTRLHDWGWGTYNTMVPPSRIRLPE